MSQKTKMIPKKMNIILNMVIPKIVRNSLLKPEDLTISGFLTEVAINLRISQNLWQVERKILKMVVPITISKLVPITAT